MISSNHLNVNYACKYHNMSALIMHSIKPHEIQNTRIKSLNIGICLNAALTFDSVLMTMGSGSNVVKMGTMMALRDQMSFNTPQTFLRVSGMLILYKTDPLCDILSNCSVPHRRFVCITNPWLHPSSPPANVWPCGAYGIIYR